MEELINIKEAAEYLRLNYMTVYRLAQKRRLPAFKVGGNWRFKRETLDKWMAEQANMENGNILVVDDDPMIREILKEIIQKQGYRVSAVEDGESALKEIERQDFDLIFLDLMMPGTSGVDTLKSIKGKDKNAVVVIVTGFADDPLALKAMSLGPLFLIRKPFKEKDILEVLKIVMRGKMR